MVKTKNEEIKVLIEWFKTYDCEDTDEVIKKRQADLPKNDEHRIIDFFNEYRKAQGLPLIDAEGNEIRK